MPLEFFAIVLMVVLIPGVDQLMVLRNTLAKGRVAGLATAIGIGTASSIQALLASLGIEAVIVASQPVFEAIRWVGVAYLLWLGFSSLRSAVHGDYDDAPKRAAQGHYWAFEMASCATSPTQRCLCSISPFYRSSSALQRP